MSKDEARPPGMSAATATRLEYSIISLGVLALALIFQPFSLTLFGVGCGLVVLAGLANNLLPLCEPGRPLGSIARIGAVVLAIFFAVALVAIGAAYLYGLYLAANR
jgi:hypothetical protein